MKEFIKNLLEEVYREITLSILSFFTNIPNFLLKFTIFILIAILGYIIGRIADFFTKIIIFQINLDKFIEEKKLGEILFNIKPSIYIRKLLKYYIYIYFIIIGLSKFEINVSILFSYLNIIYIIIIILSISFIVSGIISSIIGNITNKKLIKSFVRGIIIYIFFIWALDFVNFPTEVFKIVLTIFLISLAISVGIASGVLLVLEHKESIRKLLE